MSKIQVENLTFSYPSSYDLIFDHASFQLDTDWKLGFVGRNGRGKTTFLNLLLGKYEYKGTISSSVEFDYFPYVVSDPSLMTDFVVQEVCPQAQQWEIVRELSLMDVDDEVLWRPFETLSNGEQTKVLLAALFLNPGHFLLIDEPTNHLDLEARQKVAAYLKRKKGFILVSHDRMFIDRCVDHILSINRATIEVQSGNYSSWMANFEKRQESELAQNERLKKDIKRMQAAARRTSNWSDAVEKTKKNGFGNTNSKVDKGYIGHKAAKMMQRAKNIERHQNEAISQKSKLLKDAEINENLKLSPLRYHADLLAAFEKVSVVYDDHEIGDPITFDIQRGERVVLDGRNGSGKSSLLKLIVGQKIDYRGTLTIGSNLKISYVPQDASFLHGTLGDFARECEIDESFFKAILRKMGFERVQFEKKMEDYSAGQKKKVLIAKSLCEPAHLYIWDEPLNYIDIYSRLQIEKLLKEFEPTMLFVEHDAAFREVIATKVVKL